MTQKTTQNPWQFDVRVRERNLKAGSLTDKELEKYLGTLPDLDGHVESFATPQPALEQPRVAPPAPVSASYDDDEDDEDDEDEDEPVAAAPAPAAALEDDADDAGDEPAPAPGAHDPGAGES